MVLTEAAASLLGSGIMATGSFGSGLLSAGVSNWQNNKARAFAAEQQAEYLGWLEHMSNTAHQREVKDLRAAGLNPLLSVMGGQGASTPGGGMATPAGLESVGDKMNLALNASQIKLNNENAKLQRQQQDQVRAETDFKIAEKAKTLAEKIILDKDAEWYEKRAAKEMEQITSQIQLNIAQKGLVNSQQALTEEETKYVGYNAKTNRMGANAGLTSSQASMIQAQTAQRTPYRDAYKTAEKFFKNKWKDIRDKSYFGAALRKIKPYTIFK